VRILASSSSPGVDRLMAPQQQPVEGAPRRPARDLIDAVLEHMREYLEPLKYSTLAPSRYLVYLHASEYARLEGIVPILQEQTVRALSEELETLNRRPALHRYADRLLRRRPSLVQNAGNEWHVEFLQDPDGDVRPGDILVASELLLPENPELGVGERTRRITTVHAGQRVTTKEQVVSRLPEPSQGRVLARIAFDDDTGHHSHDVMKDSVTVGRGGIAYPIDVRIVASVDVSREHTRIRRDPATGRFFLIDLSSLGTTVDGRRVLRGYDEVDGTKRENGTEMPLPERARIGLADTVYLDFQAVS
jgi:FHA domain-containing protein